MKLAIKIAAAATMFAVSTAAQALLIGLSSKTDALYRIDTGTGYAEFLISSGANYAGIGLAFVRGELYASDRLVHIGEPWDVRTARVDMEAGASISITPQDGSLNWHGLAGNDAEGVLYAIALDQGNVLKRIGIDGTVSSIGTGTGIDGRGMEYDNVRGILYATNTADDSLYRVDTITGIATKIGPLGIDTTFIGLAVDELSGVLYANQVPDACCGIGSLFEVDTATGNTRLIGSNFALFIDGLAWTRDPSAVPEPTSIALCLVAFGSLSVARRLRRKVNPS